MPKDAGKVNPVVGLLSGATAGAIECVATWPTEYVKTQLQLQDKSNPKFAGPLDCARKTVAEHGPLGLYRGLGVLLAGSIPKAGVRFGAFEFFKNQFAPPESEQLSDSGRALRNLAAGLCAGVTEAILVVTPLETVKVRNIESNRGLIAGISGIMREEGLRGMYKGVVPTMVKQATNQGTRFLAFGEWKRAMAKYNGTDGTITPLQSLSGGVLCGCLSVFVNNPVDVVKTRMQGAEAVQYKGTWDCVKSIAVKEGALAFYKGTSARLARVAPGQGIIFMSYESIKDALAKVL